MPKTYYNAKPMMSKITDIEDECKDTKTFWIELPYKIDRIKAGQIVMLWIPGVDEYPIGVAGYSENILELSVAKMGEGTSALFEKQIGDLVGIRGFFGKGFNPPEGVIHILAGGGFGMPPLKFLINQLLERKNADSIYVFQGARSKNLLMYLEKFQNLDKENKIIFRPCTDDGSFGDKGFPTTGVENLLNQIDQPSVIYAAGPEIMMKILFNIGKNFSSVQDMKMSLADRYMRCGFGLCGACVVDPVGLRICIDGPVFSAKQLDQITDFGTYARTESGAKKRI